MLIYYSFDSSEHISHALKTTVEDDYSNAQLVWANDIRLIMITANRRENLK